MKAAVVGATGMVGRDLLDLLERRKFPLAALSLFASPRSAGKKLRFHGKMLGVSAANSKTLRGFDLVFFATEKDVPLKLAPELIRSGAWVIDDSSAFRMDPRVPLVVPEVNGHVLSPRTRLIAGPNCIAVPLVMAVHPIARRFGLAHVRASTYQSISGAGKRAMDEFVLQARAWLRNQKPPRPKKLPQTIMLNVFPQCDRFGEGDYTGEEIKIKKESRKILGLPALKISATAVRVPVLIAHSIALWVETKKTATAAQLRRALAGADGVQLMDDPGKNIYPMPLTAARRWPVYVGRVRRGEKPNEFLLWVSADNLLKGSALNSVQIAEYLLHKGWLASRAR
ncbi:MAG: aspartate-semialdehyde dehydrogenase [Elusimicrobia bacterium RIFCSPLOWO2_12_FULL_59_9]|nr:MAG: aspartate-semialdehyde dehydrogenase [Elusimicrobia bacterium RIFCSPLOWO2_12_FULL_59_9]